MFHFEVRKKKKGGFVLWALTEAESRKGERSRMWWKTGAAVGKASSRGWVLYILCLLFHEFFLDQAPGPRTAPRIWDVKNCAFFKRVCPCPFFWCSGQLAEFYPSFGPPALGSCLLLPHWEVTSLVPWLLKIEKNCKLLEKISTE